MPPRLLPLKKRTLPYALPPQRATTDTRQTEGRLPAEGESEKSGSTKAGWRPVEEGEIREGEIEEGEIKFNWQKIQGQHGHTAHTHAKGQSHPPTLPPQGHQAGAQLVPSALKRKIFVGELPYRLNDAEFHAYFSQFGAVTDAVVMRKGDGTTRFFGFITYSSPDVYQQVMAQPEHTIHGKNVYLQPADGKDQASQQSRSKGRAQQGRSELSAAAAAAAAAALV